MLERLLGVAAWCERVVNSQISQGRVPQNEQRHAAVRSAHPGLRAYRPDLAVPSDLDEFWATTLEETRRHGLAATFEPVDSGLVVIETFDATFAGFGGAPIRAWLHLPRQRSGRLPAVVEYVGCGGGRGLAHERTLFAAAGYAHLVMDTRGGLRLERRRHAGSGREGGAGSPS